jgi:CRISPR/Cas system CMR-associated protein Cmr5 small subunit
MKRNLPSAYDFKTLPETIAFYTSKVAEIMKNRDRSMHNEIMRFKKELHERIEKEEV